MTIFQKSSNKAGKTLEIERLLNTKLKLESMFIPPLKQFIKPIPPLKHFPNITSTVPPPLKQFIKPIPPLKDFLVQYTRPTWAATNPLLVSHQDVTKCQLLPLYLGTPINW